MPESQPRRLSLLYQLYLASQASRTLMRQSMAATDMTGEEYALYSYFFANGARTLTQTARDLGMPLTTLATLLAEPVARGEILRAPHPRDRRAKLLDLTDVGRARLQAAIPAFSAGYREVLAALEADGADLEELYASLDTLRRAMVAAAAALREGQARPA